MNGEIVLVLVIALAVGVARLTARPAISFEAACPSFARSARAITSLLRKMTLKTVLVLIVLVAVAWVTRYQYFNNGMIRVDRWTGDHQDWVCDQQCRWER